MSKLLNFFRRKRAESPFGEDIRPIEQTEFIEFPFMSVDPDIFTRAFIKPMSFTEQDRVVKHVSDFFTTAKISMYISRLESSHLYTVIYVTLDKSTNMTSAALSKLNSSLELYLGKTGTTIIPDKTPNGFIVLVPREGVKSMGMGNMYAEDAFKSFVLDGYNNLTKVMRVLPITLGYDAFNNPVILDLAKLPSLLIGGSSGSGKSNLIHTIMATLLTYVPKNMLDLYLVDTKIVELNKYEGLAQVKKFVSKHDAISGLCHEVIDIMSKRYICFANDGVSDIEQYNREYAGFPMPYIVLVIEEFGDLMQTGNNIVESMFIRILQQGRAAGIHVIAATQRPSADMINTTIKANMPCRIALKVSSHVDSKIIINSSGAEKLTSVGQMIVYESGNYTKVQSLFISTKEINKLINLTRKQ